MIVRDSVAWALSRICDQVPEVALSKEYIDNLLDVLIENLESEPRVATNVCWVCMQLKINCFIKTKLFVTSTL